MDFRIRQLESFLTLSSMLNFCRASEVLFITQPALTLQIKALEEVFDAKLFDRNNQEVRLTRAGEALVGHARFIIQEIKEAHYDMHFSPERYCLRVSCGEAGGVSIVPKIVRRLAHTHPQFILQQYEYDAEDQVAALLDGRVDALLMQENLEIEGAYFEALHDETVVAAVSKASPLAAKVTASLEELASYPVIIPSACNRRRRSSFAHKTFAWCGLSPEYVEHKSSMKAQLAAVESGAGIALCPEPLKSLRMRGIKFLSIADPAPKLRLGLTINGPMTRSIDIIRNTAIRISAEIGRTDQIQSGLRRSRRSLSG
jgi:DNA-binding transcriptional LysR family regulator